MKNKYKPKYNIPPSFTIKECISYLLKEKTNSDLSPEEWEGLINNELKIDDRIAVELEKVFKTPKQFWLNLQNNYNEREKKMNKKKHFQESLVKKGGSNPESKTLKPNRIPPSQKTKEKEHDK